jgi:hypothetical protein
LPILFTVELPLPYRGVFLNGIFSASAGGSPPLLSPPGAILPGFYLFSAPARPSVPGAAAVRACLVEHTTQTPAAFAALEIRVKGQKWYGIADERGCLAVLFPSPPIRPSLGGSLPVRLQTPLSEISWELSVRVRYQPSALAYLPGSQIPELRSIFQQSGANIYPIETGPPVTEWSQDLFYGQELVMRTENLSALLVEPGVSPP